MYEKENPGEILCAILSANPEVADTRITGCEQQFSDGSVTYSIDATLDNGRHLVISVTG